MPAVAAAKDSRPASAVGGGDRADDDEIVVGGAVSQLDQVGFGHHDSAAGLGSEWLGDAGELALGG